MSTPWKIDRRNLSGAPAKDKTNFQEDCFRRKAAAPARMLHGDGVE
jgi:hypothetical protein